MYFAIRYEKELKCDYEKTIKTAVHVEDKVIILDSITYVIQTLQVTSSVQSHSERSQ